MSFIWPVSGSQSWQGRAGQGRSGLVMSRSSRRVVYSDMSLYLFVPFS